MTAIAGIVSDQPDPQLERLCLDALVRQSRYGGGRATVRALPEAVLGIDLHAVLPEDQADRQPLENSRYLLVADLRIDNRRELIARLGQPTQGTRQSDAEILLLAWSGWQESCLDRIAGDFAIAVYDRHEQLLTLARSPVGARPLHFRIDGDRLFFASMPSGVVGREQLRPDLAALAARLAGVGLEGDRTSFRNVRSIAPGEILQFGRTGLRRGQYWKPTPSDRINMPLHERIGALRECLDTVVESGMRRVSPALGLHLSSGYDSSAIAGTAAKLRGSNDRLVAFTAAPANGLEQLNFRGRIADESGIAAKTASELGLEHVIIRDGTPLLDAMHNHARTYQQPVSNILNHGWWTKIAENAAEMGSDIMLTASAGNFTLSYGGLPVLAHWLRSGRLLHWFAEARAVRRSGNVRWQGLLYSSFGPWLPGLAADLVERLFLGAPPPRDIHYVRSEWIAGRASGWSRPALSGNPFADRLAMIRQLDFGLHRKGLLAQTGIDERDPTADRRLVELCLSMAPEELLKDGTYKPVARAALSDRVPKQVLDLSLRGYQGADWAARLNRNNMFDAVEEIATSSAADMLDLEAMRRAINSWPDRNFDESTKLFRVGRKLTDALAAGMFIREVERHPDTIGI